MDIILRYILIGLIGFLIISLFSRLFSFYWKAGYDKRQKKREARRNEKLKWKYCEVRPDNPILNQMMKDRTIIFMGHKGKGKSLMMNIMAHFLWKKRLEKNKKNRRYLKYKKPDYLETEKKLENEKKLPIYSNLDFRDYDTKFTKQELLPYFEMQKKAVEGAIYCIDEVSSLYGKEIYNNNDEFEKERKKDIKENSKKGRHYSNSWILGTEQDGQDIYIGIRENGYAIVNCIQTVVKILPTGKTLRFIRNFLNFVLPAFLTVNLHTAFSEQLFWSGKVKTFFKLLLPSYFSMPILYYDKKQAINDKIKRKYQRFEVLFQYNGSEYWIRFGHESIFDYDTRAYKDEYDKLFDKNGNRIHNKETAYA